MSVYIVTDRNTVYIRAFDCKRIDLVTEVLRDDKLRASMLNQFTNDTFKIAQLDAQWKNNQRDDAFMKFVTLCLDNCTFGFHQCSLGDLYSGVSL